MRHGAETGTPLTRRGRCRSDRSAGTFPLPRVVSAPAGPGSERPILRTTVPLACPVSVTLCIDPPPTRSSGWCVPAPRTSAGVCSRGGGSPPAASSARSTARSATSIPPIRVTAWSFPAVGCWSRPRRSVSSITVAIPIVNSSIGAMRTIARVRKTGCGCRRSATSRLARNCRSTIAGRPTPRSRAGAGRQTAGDGSWTRTNGI